MNSYTPPNLYQHPYFQAQPQVITEHIPIEKTYVEYETITRRVSVPMTYEVTEYVPSYEVTYSTSSSRISNYNSPYVSAEKKQPEQQQSEQKFDINNSIHYNSDRYRPGLSSIPQQQSNNNNGMTQSKSRRRPIFD